MEKMDMHTKNIADKNFEILSSLFPNAVTETIVGYDEGDKPIIERAIDADVLRQEISYKVIDGDDERYRFSWPDKKRAMLLANSPVNSTLRPIRDISVNFDETENIYIEGDNLEALKLMQETYLGKVKMIYFDPPYNTGHDFLYEDDFADSLDEYLLSSNQFDDFGNRLYQNTDSEGRFHTKWLNEMFPRIKLARNLLKDDGLCFISIDDNELENLIKCCNEIFGEINHVATIAWRRQDGQTNIGNFARVKEYILIYSKTSNYKMGRMPLSEKAMKDYQYEDERGKYGRGRLREPVRGHHNYDVVSPSGVVCKGPWLIPETEFHKLEQEGLVHWPEKEGGSPRRKIYLADMLDKGQISNDFWGIEYGTNQRASIEVEKLFGKRYFDFPKPVSLIKMLVKLGTEKDEDAIVLDFFSGSGTTAQAVQELNAEDGFRRKFILVQIPELIDEKSKAYIDGFRNICEIGEKRIALSAEKIKGEGNVRFDDGFRVFRVDSSNMKDIYYNPEQIQQQSLFASTENIKEDRTPEDLLFQVMLDLGVLLSSKIEEKIIAGKKVFNVADGFLIACFDNDITEETVKAVAQEKPYYAVFRDSSMANDSVATNFEQIFATYSPATVRKVL